MPAFINETRPEARHSALDSTRTTPARSLARKMARKLARRGNRSRNVMLATAVVAALLGVTAFSQASGQSPDSSDLSLASSTSNKAGQAPGQTKKTTPSPTASPEPTATSTPAPEPTSTATPTPEPTATATATATSAPVAASPAASTTAMPVGVPGAWTMAFSDEFDGSSLDTAKWSNCWFSPSCGTMNKVTTSPGNVAVSNGNLVLTLGSSTSGALVSTNPRGGATSGYEFTTGYVEARIRFPGDGTSLYNWPAFWTNGQSWPADGENDIAEVLSGKMTVNYHSSSGAHNQGTVPGDWSNNFHTFGLHRMANSADVYYDGVKVKSYATDDGGAPHYLILNVGASGSSPAAYGAASQLQVDYVRAWK